MNINLVYIYPKTIEINNEINLLRIVNKKIKESLVFYCIKDESVYKIYVLNTMTGEDIHLKDCSGKNNLNNLINNIKTKEEYIKELDNLETIEKYILKVIKD